MQQNETPPKAAANGVTNGLEDLVKMGDNFIYPGQNCQLKYIKRGPNLLISFDNLTMVDEGFPRDPWLSKYAALLGYSNLGIQAFQKDWFRASNPELLILALRATGFFDKFEKILITGTSMGGFGALCFGHLVPRAHVAAFSPQSTLNGRLVPKDGRFAPARRNYNWRNPPYHDALINLPRLQQAAILYDPYLPEDLAQCQRLVAPGVTHHKIPFFDHSLPRLIAKSAAMETLVRDLMETGKPSPGFFQLLRNRRSIRIWCRRFISYLERTGQHHRRERVAEFMRRSRPDYMFAQAKPLPHDADQLPSDEAIVTEG